MTEIEKIIMITSIVTTIIAVSASLFINILIKKLLRFKLTPVVLSTIIAGLTIFPIIYQVADDFRLDYYIGRRSTLLWLSFKWIELGSIYLITMYSYSKYNGKIKFLLLNILLGIVPLMNLGNGVNNVCWRFNIAPGQMDLTNSSHMMHYVGQPVLYYFATSFIIFSIIRIDKLKKERHLARLNKVDNRKRCRSGFDIRRIFNGNTNISYGSSEHTYMYNDDQFINQRSSHNNMIFGDSSYNNSSNSSSHYGYSSYNNSSSSSSHYGYSSYNSSSSSSSYYDDSLYNSPSSGSSYYDDSLYNSSSSDSSYYDDSLYESSSAIGSYLDSLNDDNSYGTWNYGWDND